MFIWNFSSSSSQYVPLGSLYQVLHEGSGLVVDASKAIQFAIDVAKVSFKEKTFLWIINKWLFDYKINIL